MPVAVDEVDVIWFSPITFMLRPAVSYIRRQDLAVSIVAFSRVSVFVSGSYFTVPLTPSITLRSLQFSSVTNTPLIIMG